MESSVYCNRKTKFYEYLRNTTSIEHLSKLLNSNWRKPCNINNYLSHELVEMHLFWHLILSRCKPQSIIKSQ